MFSEILVLLILSIVSLSEASSAGPGQPLFLSQYLPGNPGLAKKLSLVQVPGYSYPSYSGFLTVNQSAGSNSFFWFFPAETMPQSAPVLLWLQGGPGASSLYGLFSENGPFSVSADGKSLVSNPYRWTKRFSMLYIDNPVGAGFSFTQSPNGFSRNEHDVGENLYSALSQFFQIFSDLRNNEFYITGESYGGKYVPSAAYTIHHKNQNPNNAKINLKGIAVGDGLMDPITQLTDFANQAYYFSIADHNERQVIAEYDRKIKENLQNDKPIEAFRLFDEMMNGDFYPYPTYFENITGSSNYFNFLTPIYPPNPYDTYLNLTSTRLNIHVGDVAYWDYNASVELHLKHDWMVSVKHKVEFLLDQQYKVLIYNGQADVILGAPLCENLMQKLKWVGEKEYKKSKKFIWKVAKTDQIVAGFVRHALNLVQIVVRDAGHMVPLDQPRAAFDMISRFIDGKTFKF